MSETERLIKFHLLGQDFAFYTGASEEEMGAILTLVKEQIEAYGGRGGGTIPVSKVAVMACLNIASRYLRLQNEHETYRRDTEDQVRRLNEKLRSVLAAEQEIG
ncbi:MAG: cell division protein ZapA [Desulfofustis sp.]|nr:cell division protein ZapA [Desulfofustis sp.]